jgi:iron complex transport system substrate-binding protein
MTFRGKGLGLALLVLLLALLAAPQAAVAAGVTVTDDLGREVRIPAPARRIVSLAPNLTEIVFALGLGDRLVGVTDFCDFPPEATRIPRVGGVMAPSTERVLELTPDLVLATTVGNREGETLGLARLGLPLVVTDPRDLDGVARSFELVGRAASAPEAGARLAAAFRTRLAKVREAVAGRPRPRTLLLVWPDPLVAAGPRSFLTALLEAAGGANALAGPAAPAVAEQYPRLGIESVLALAPEVIVVAAYRDTGAEAIERLRRYPQVPAVRDGRIAAIDHTVLVRPGPRLADAAEALARAIHR